MAGQDPFRPREKSGIGMPAVLPGMNRIAPARIQGSKGSKNEQEMLGSKKRGKGEDDQKLLTRAQKRMERAINAESENRAAGLEDLNFLAGKQWPSEVAAQRNIDHRPCLTINKLPTFVNQVVNPLREDRPTINISPVGERSDREVAKMYRGLIRAIERDCFAPIAYDQGLTNAAGAPGWGYWRVNLEYEAPDSFNQVISVGLIMNPFTVYCDPSHIQPDASDMKWCFVTEMIPKQQFEDDYPDIDPIPYQQVAIGDSLKDWIGKDEVRIAEYFEFKSHMRTLVELDNGHVGWEDELDDLVRAKLKRGTFQIVDEREADDPTLKHYKLTAHDVIDETEWPGKWIPIVKCLGNVINVEGKNKISGIVRNAKDPQRMYNYWKTAETELIALAPKAPWIMEEGQVEGHEDEWRMANIRSNPYLTYKGTSIAGRPAPPPQRQQFAGVPAGVVQAQAGAAQDMMATTGVRFDATLGERMMDESGKAIREIRRSGDIGSTHYGLNYGWSLRHTGEIFVDLIPKIYSAKRMVTILREDDTEEQVVVDPHLAKPSMEQRRPDGKIMRMFNPTYGKYGVTVTLGPSYATKRIEASENMMQFAKNLPQTAALFADLIAKNQDWPGAEEIAARIAKTLPPGLLQPDQKDMTPQTQALITQMDTKIKELTQHLAQAMAALTDKQQDRAIEVDKINKDFEAKLLNIVMQMETKMAGVEEKAVANFNTHIGAQIQQLGEGVTTLLHTIENPPKAGEGGEDDVQIPPEAARSLMEGHVTQFANGHKFTLKGGKPQRIKDDGDS
jgi:hypothetical protein